MLIYLKSLWYHLLMGVSGMNDYFDICLILVPPLSAHLTFLSDAAKFHFDSVAKPQFRADTEEDRASHGLQAWDAPIGKKVALSLVEYQASGNAYYASPALSLSHQVDTSSGPEISSLLSIV